MGSVVASHRLHCFAACGIFPEQRLNLYLLWQLDFPLPLPPGKSSSRSFLLALCFSCVWVRISLSSSYCKLLELHEFGMFLIIISSHILFVLFPFPSPSGIPIECMWV